jgi:primosomal protein N' (replication factor Y)
MLPVARVAVDLPLAHLDRPFDYEVPATLDADAVPGSRVRVRFAGQLVGGFLLERAAATEHPGRLARLERVVSAEPVLSPAIARLARDVADRYAGTLADVLRLAVPPRHAAAESASAGSAEPALPPTPPEPGGWARYPRGPALLRALGAGAAPRAVWTALPGPEWPALVATAVRAALAAGRGALVVVPDHRDVARVGAAVTAACGPGQHVELTAEPGPRVRYRRFLDVRRGRVRAVVGTRAAVFAPVVDLGLLVLWDDGDDLHAEPHAPYPHAREVLALRSHHEGAALLLGGVARTAEAQLLVASGWAQPVEATRAVTRAAAPRVLVAGGDADLARDPAARTARLPSVAFETARTALADGPVLVQVPRRGYLPATACATCHAPARCPACAGPLTLAGGRQLPVCGWCGQTAGEWRCPECEGARLRAVVVGARRTAEELGRAFPRVPVRLSGGDGGVLDAVPARPALVVATPGAEPPAEGGYAAALLLDGWALLGRADLRAAEEALRRWLTAAALVRPGTAGGRVVLLAEAGLPAVQALVRWDPAGYAARELAERERLDFPPAVRLALLTGAADAVAEVLALADLPGSAAVLGPLPVDGGRSGDERPTVRSLVRVPRGDGPALSAALKAAQAVRSARKAADFVTVRVDPAVLG